MIAREVKAAEFWNSGDSGGISGAFREFPLFRLGVKAIAYILNAVARPATESSDYRDDTAQAVLPVSVTASAGGVAHGRVDTG